MGDEILWLAPDGEMEVVNAVTNVARWESRLWDRVISEIHFHLAGERVVRAAAAGIGIAGAVKVEEDGSLELLTGTDADRRQFLFAFGRELVGDDLAADGGEDVAGVSVAIFVEAGHRILILDAADFDHD